MELIPERARSALTWRLSKHANRNWPTLDRIQTNFRGRYCYIDAIITGEPIKLCRLRYTGGSDNWLFALWHPASNTYRDANLDYGLPQGPPENALDTACEHRLPHAKQAA
ncbi:MAG: hypothetical protein LBG11_03930 [Bifidobacteriaceae bacterium]|jgi:hypothetical protein|nr:hypothetical protein [Bifidobacteriaceae bacterium]